jgi:hypothetical protein
MAASNLPVRPSDPKQNESRRIDNLIGSLLHSLEILGAAKLRVAAELESSPLTIDEVIDGSHPKIRE